MSATFADRATLAVAIAEFFRAHDRTDVNGAVRELGRVARTAAEAIEQEMAAEDRDHWAEEWEKAAELIETALDEAGDLHDEWVTEAHKK